MTFRSSESRQLTQATVSGSVAYTIKGVSQVSFTVFGTNAVVSSAISQPSGDMTWSRPEFPGYYCREPWERHAHRRCSPLILQVPMFCFSTKTQLEHCLPTPIFLEGVLGGWRLHWQWPRSEFMPWGSMHKQPRIDLPQSAQVTPLSPFLSYGSSRTGQSKSPITVWLMACIASSTHSICPRGPKALSAASAARQTLPATRKLPLSRTRGDTASGAEHTYYTTAALKMSCGDALPTMVGLTMTYRRPCCSTGHDVSTSSTHCWRHEDQAPLPITPEPIGRIWDI